MKLTLTSNANLKLHSHLSELDLKYGFAYYGKVEKTEHFGLKLIAKLESFFKVSLKDQEIANAIGEAVQFSNDTVQNKALNEMEVQINTPSIISSAFKEMLSWIAEKEDPIFEVFNTRIANIRVQIKQIVLGTDFVNNNKE